jgi:exosome complex component RRP42
MINSIIIAPKINAERVKKYLDSGKRFDGRDKDEFRDIEIETGVSVKAEGSARARIGKTEVIVGVKMDVGTPYADSQDAGNLSVMAELLPLSSPRFELGPPRFEAVELGRLVDRSIRESKFINLKGLCIKEGEKVWNIFLDVYTINDDGNLLDTAILAAIAALKEAKIPVYNEETEKVQYGEWTNKKLPLSKEIPMPITVHKIGNNFIVDPTREEEDLSEVRVAIAMHDGTIHSMQKGNSDPLTTEQFSEVLDLAEAAEKKILKKVEKYLK